MQITAGHHGNLTIDLAALRRNYQFLDGKSAAACETGAVVKADAYGLGIKPVAEALYDAGARTFFVASFEEGAELRGILSKLDVRIFILNGFLSGAIKAYQHYNLIPILNSFDDIQSYAQGADDARLPALIHIDTAMNRLGVSAAEITRLKQDTQCLDALDILYVMSHFTSSEVSAHPSNAAQRQKFEELSAALGMAKNQKSLCNSGGIFLGAEYHYDLIRPGVALYGGHPGDNQAVNPMSSPVSLSVPILQVREAQKGESVGYNETYRLSANAPLATVSLGYADGVFRTLSNQGRLYYEGCELPIRGRVSMDLITCDLSNLPESKRPKAGDMVEVLGAHQTIDDLARAAGTISYEVLTSLGRRYHRSYIG